MTLAPTNPRVAIMLDHPAQYISPAFRALAGRGSIQEQIFYWSVPDGAYFDEGFGRDVQWNTDLYSGYSWWTPGKTADSAKKRTVEVYKHLRSFRPHAVLCFGWSRPVAIAGIVYAKAFRIPVIVFADANGRQPTDTLRRRLRGPIMRVVLNQITGALSTGVANTLFYTRHGMPSARIHPGTLPIELQAFRSASRLASPDRDTRRTIIGFAGKLVAIKGVDELIEAVKDLPRDQSWQLRIVGDGPERDRLEHLVADESISDYVEFYGLKNTNEMPACLADMDILVMPSRRESRGLVAIEAMAAGAVPVVSSATGVWGNGDAVDDGVTGFVYPSGEPSSLSRILSRLLTDQDLRFSLAARAMEKAEEFGPDSFADNTITAVNHVLFRTSRS